MKKNRKRQKGERRTSAVMRLSFVALALLLQIAFVFFLANFLQEYTAAIYAALEIAALMAAIHIYNKSGDSTYKLSWVIVLLTLPVVGFLLYAFWSGSLQRKRIARQHPDNTAEPESVRMRSEMSADKLNRQLPNWSRLSSYLRRRDFLLYQNTRVTYFPEGEQLINDILTRVERAEHFIFLEYFIIAEGQLWDRMSAVLCEKAKGGVEVKVIFDDFGNIRRFSGETIERLRDAGVEVFVFNPVQQYVNRLYFN